MIDASHQSIPDLGLYLWIGGDARYTHSHKLWKTVQYFTNIVAKQFHTT